MSLNRTTDLSKLTDDDKALIYQLAQREMSHREIAQVVGCDHSTVSRWLAKLTPTIDLAKKRAQHRALEVLEAGLDGAIKAARDGSPEHALEVADRLDVLARRERDSGARGGIQVLVLNAGQQTLEPPTIDLSPATFASIPADPKALSD